MKMIPSALLVLLSLFSTGLAAYGDAEVPTRFLRVELLDAGAMAMPLAAQLRALRFDFEFSRLRVGVTALSIGVMPIDPDEGPLFGGFGELNAGFLLYRRPRRTSFFYGTVPSIWVEAAVVPGFWNLNPDFVGRADVRASVDYYGIGFDVDAGVVTRSGSHAFTFPYARAGVIVGVASFRL